MARRMEAMGKPEYQPDYSGLAGENGEPRDGEVIRIAEVRNDPAEWPEDIRVRQWPKVNTEARQS
jgi:hypothetical protein